MLAYFFEPAIETISPEGAMSVVSSENVFDVMDCGDQSLESGDWPIVGVLSRFSYSEWPVPIFQARDGSCVRFDQKDYTVPVDLFRDSISSKYYKYTGYGHKAVKIVLSKKFNGRVE